MPDLKFPQLNQITISGRLCRDPELKYVSGGEMAMIKTSIAVDDGFGEKRKTYFVDFACFGKTADLVYPQLHKGVPVIITGRFTVEEWEAKDGSGKRSKAVIIADRVHVLVWGDDAQSHNHTTTPEKAPPRGAQDAELIPEDDIPF